MHKAILLQTIYSKIVNCESFFELNNIKRQLDEDLIINSNNYDYKDVLILSLAMEFRSYVLLKDQSSKKNQDIDDIERIYREEICTLNERTFLRIKRLFPK